MRESAHVGIDLARYPEVAARDEPIIGIGVEVDCAAPTAAHRVLTAGQFGVGRAVAIEDGPTPKAAEIRATECRVVAVLRDRDLVDGQRTIVRASWPSGQADQRRSSHSKSHYTQKQTKSPHNSPLIDFCRTRVRYLFDHSPLSGSFCLLGHLSSEGFARRTTATTTLSRASFTVYGRDNAVVSSAHGTA